MTRTLADLIHELTRPHLSRNGDRIAYVEPLLETLHSLITPSPNKTADGGGGGGGGKNPPVNLDALDLWRRIVDTVDKGWPYAGHPSAVKVPTARKLQAWHANTADPRDAALLHGLASRWVEQIREALEPTKKMPLQGACPRCQNTHVELVDEEGTVKFDTAILAYPGAVPVYAECRVCLTRWEHEDLHLLRDQLM